MSFGLNKAELIGNVVRDPEVNMTRDGKQVGNFTVATTQYWHDPKGEKKEQTEFHRIIVWDKLADIAKQMLSKGTKVYVEGRLQTREWEDAEGRRRQTTEIVATSVICLDRKPS